LLASVFQNVATTHLCVDLPEIGEALLEKSTPLFVAAGGEFN
jgi:hypothetical protein